ncbi:hypothetical protein AcW1_002558 [Taiwanofungus camphoratus]|nr:hypothetical protein AcV5_009788 [Antrodia cinnamomea]KAI0926456.1 hypothetical protein AcV7_005390 [Antrodia cinnamomea]KAI0943386.1 hypothetical protein AcW1_002558 [Antrodia cinnamomea]
MTAMTAPGSPSSSNLSQDSKRHILSQLPADVKVIAAAPARVYHASFGARQDSWTYTGLQGMLVFGRDRVKVYADRKLGTGPGTSFEHNYWFRLIDTTGRGVIWIHQIPDNFQYQLDKPFFHVFPGKTRMFGFRFDEDLDAEKFYRKITSRLQITVPSPQKIKKSMSPTSSRKKQLTPSMISSPAPGTFVHVTHVGYSQDGNIEASDNVEPGWTLILEELQGHGVNEKMVTENMDFIEGFLAGAQAAQNGDTKATDSQAKITRDHGSEGGTRRKAPKRKPAIPT